MNFGEISRVTKNNREKLNTFALFIHQNKIQGICSLFVETVIYFYYRDAYIIITYISANEKNNRVI